MTIRKQSRVLYSYQVTNTDDIKDLDKFIKKVNSYKKSHGNVPQNNPNNFFRCIIRKVLSGKLDIKTIFQEDDREVAKK